MVHAPRVLRHYLLGGRASQSAGCWTDFDLRTGNQAIKSRLLKTNKHLNKMGVQWLDEIEDFGFDVRHLPGARNPMDPLSRRGFSDGNGPAPSTGDPDSESQQELFSRPVSALLVAIRVGLANTRRTAAAAFANVQEGDARPSTLLGRGSGINPPVY